jgi:L-fucose isomerase-like protein
VTAADPPATRFTRAVRVGLLTPYFAFFESRFPPDYRASQETYARGIADALRGHGLEVTESGLVDGPESAARARDAFAAAGVDVVVAAATMAAPPTYGSEALAGFDGPIVVWDDRRIDRFTDQTDEVEATRASGILGSIMLANVLGREGRPYVTVSSEPGDAADVARAVTGAAAARALRGARLGLLGGIIPGYGDVVLDERTAAALGLVLVPVEGERVERALARTDGSDGSPDGPGSALPDGLAAAPEAEPLLERSLRVHRVLAALCEDLGLDALALNCHSDVLRWSEALGVVSCLASSLLWSSGLPVACTGDAATAVALMVAARVAGSAQYCEGYAVESETGELVVSSCGMADLGLRAPGSTARLCPNQLYPGRHGLGLATRFTFDAGPATIVGFGPATSTLPARFVAASGSLTGRGFAHLNGPSGSLTFDRPGAGLASRAWIDAGPAHHLALVRGDRTAELRAAATFLGTQLIEVDAAGGRETVAARTMQQVPSRS